jgi:hypothetical protein
MRVFSAVRKALTWRIVPNTIPQTEPNAGDYTPVERATRENGEPVYVRKLAPRGPTYGCEDGGQ